MRVTDDSLFRQFINNYAFGRSRVEEALNQLASGKRVTVSSDDPVAARQALDLRGDAVRVQGFLRSGDSARFGLAAIDSVLAQAFNEAINVVSFATSAASGTATTGLDALAGSVDEIRGTYLDLANTVQGGRYLFAGTETLTAAFDPSGAYQGSANEAQSTLDRNVSVGVTLDGSSVFQGGGDVFQVLTDLSTVLRAGDVDGVAALLPDLEAIRDNFSSVRAQVGARLSRVEDTRLNLDDELLRLQTRIVDIEGIDLAETATRLANANNSLEALGVAGSRVLGRSLFDIIG